MPRVTTTIRLDAELYEQLRLYVYSRKMLDPKLSMSRVAELALRDYFNAQEQGQ